MIRTKKINNEVVKAIPTIETPIENVKGANLFSRLYSNIFLLAKKRSGKTSTIFKILKSCVNKESKLFIFASTVDIDQNWIFIQEWLDKREIEYETFTSIKEGKINILEEVISELSVNEEDPEDSEEDEEDPIVIFRQSLNKKASRRKRKPKKISPKYIFVFDDLGSSLRSPTVAQLLKTHRHYLARCILSSQYLHDLEPESRLQLDYVLIFGGNSEDKLKLLHKDVDLSVSFDLFLAFYKDATKEKYNFLYIDTRSEEFRKNFNHKYLLPL